MSREQKAQRKDVEEVGMGGPATGRRSLAASRYPALARALDDRGGAAGEPTIHDAATAAVEHKDGGAAVESSVAARVGAHLGADFSGVRVHSDPLAQQATAAMGARAFAYGSDVFLGAGEGGENLGLMAHELTHVAQQGAAGQREVQREVQRAVQVGDANSPAEREADQVSAAVVGGQGAPASLLVDDGPVGPGQMLKSQFIEQLRAEVTAAADAELGPIYSAVGCPYIEQYFSRYAGQRAASGEALLRRYAPAIRTARTAAEMIPAVVVRVREGVRAWRDTGQAPADLAAMAPAAAGGGGSSAQAQALRAPDGGETLASLEAELGPGQPLDGATASRMSDALGTDVSSAQIHTGPVAARKAADAGALAFAAGANVVMGAGAPSAGTFEGDALLAHELAHTVQQSGHARDPAARMQPLRSSGAGDLAGEANADAAAEAVIEHAHGVRKASLWSRISAPLGLSRCPPENPADHAAHLATINTLMRNPETNASSIAAEIAAVQNPRDRARVVRHLAGATPPAFCTEVGNYEHGDVILTAMRDGIESNVGEDLVERSNFDSLRSTIAAAITARTTAPAAPTAGVSSDLVRLNAMLTPDLGLPDYTGGVAPIQLPAAVFPGEAAARVGHVYFDPTLPVSSNTTDVLVGATNMADWRRAGGAGGARVAHYFAGYIRLGPSLLRPGATDANARSALHHEWAHYKMQVERNSNLTDPDLIAIRNERARGDLAHADGDEHALIIAGQVERDGDSVSDAELEQMMRYLGTNLAQATSQFVTIANDRVSRWALAGAPTGRPRHRRTPRQRRLVPAITRAREASLTPLLDRVDVDLP